MANGAIQEGDYVTALANLFEAEKLDAQLPEVHHSKAVAYYLKKSRAEALESARRAVELSPDYSDARNTLGKLLLEVGSLHEAEVHLKKAIADPLYRDVFKANTNLGLLYYERGDLSGARRQFELAIEAAPNQACVARYQLGRIAESLGRHREAIAYFQKSVMRICANFGEAHLALGVAYMKQGRTAEARSKFVEIQDRFAGTSVAERAVEHLRYLP